MKPPNSNRRPSLEELRAYATQHPEKFKILQDRAKQEVAEKEMMRERLQEQQRVLKEAQEAAERQTRYALTITGVPRVDLSDVRGIIAYRGWNLVHDPTNYNVILRSSTYSTTIWKPIMFANEVPTDHNTNGIYCYKITPEWLASGRAQLSGEATGLVEVRGDIIEHTDGILRAEWARILCILLDYSSPIQLMVSNVVRGLHQTYPFIPVHVVNTNQISELLFWIAFFQRQREM